MEEKEKLIWKDDWGLKLAGSSQTYL